MSETLGGRRIRGFVRPLDIAVIALYAALFALFLYFSLAHAVQNGTLTVQASGQDYLYQLDSPRTIEFTGPIGRTEVEIDELGRARISYSDCRDKICVEAGWLEKSGDWAACLPNRVMIRMDGDAPGVKDAADRLKSPLNIDATAF